MLQNTSFYLQLYPNKSMRQWFGELVEAVTPSKEKHLYYHQYSHKYVVFCMEEISNHFFCSTIFNKNLFLNIMQVDKSTHTIIQVQKYLEFFCEKNLINGISGESELNIHFSDKKKYLLREYKQITYNDFDYNWMNHINSQHKKYTELSDYFINTPYSYIWALNFIDNKENVLLYDDELQISYPILKKYMNFITEENDNQSEYKLVIINGKNKNVSMDKIYPKLKKGGLLIAKNITFEIAANTVGWHDIRTNITAFFKK